jgi:arylsulfatase A-like enzyme
MWLRIAVLGVLIGAILGCGRGSAPRLEAVNLELRLARHLPVAQVLPPLPHISFRHPAQRRYLTAGWYRFQKDENGEWSAWTKGRNAVIDVPVVIPRDLAVRIDLSPPTVSDKLPTQSLKLLWNGHTIGSFKLTSPREVLEFQVPAELQRRGPNRLDLLPLYWMDPASAGKQVGVRVWDIAFEPQVRTPRPGGPRARLKGDSIEQAAESVITFYFALPRAARLQAGGRLLYENTRLHPELSGSVDLSLLTEGGQERVLLTRNVADLARVPEFSLSEDLSQLSGQMVALSLSFSPGPDHDAARLRVRWDSLRITGRTELPQRDDRTPERRPYNVLMILFDTLRADHTEPYGATLKTPRMRGLAERGVTFVNAFSNSTWTRPSVASLLSSLYPSSHKVSSVKGTLGQDIPYLPELLREAGFRTVGISNNGQTSKLFGFDRGFDEFHEYFRMRYEILAEFPDPAQQARFVWDNYIEPVARSADQQPFFVFLHEIDPHAPYDPPPPYNAMYDFGYQGNIMGYDRSLKEVMKMTAAINQQPTWIGEADIRHLEALYSGEISFMDDYLGWLLDRLGQLGLEDRTLVIFVSDHGEEFLEHRKWGHGQSVYETLVRVPMILSLPGVLPAGGRPQCHAELLDISRTILDLLGVEAPASMQGVSLLPFIAAPDDYSQERATFARSNFNATPIDGAAPLTMRYDAVRFRNWKLHVHDLNVEAKHEFEYALYDLATDPGELHDRWATQPVVGHALRQMFDTQQRINHALDFNATASSEPGPELRENLKALGYIE